MNEDDMIFPEGGFPTMAELTASTEPQDVSTACSNGAQGEGNAPKEGCAPAATAGADGAKSALQSGFFKESPTHLDESETRWLRFLEKYPRYASEPLPAGMTEAVQAGEDPTMAFLRLENARLEHDLQLLRREQALRSACVGSARTSAPPEEPDDFAKGLLLG